jgi:hypothetical protein
MVHSTLPGDKVPTGAVKRLFFLPRVVSLASSVPQKTATLPGDKVQTGAVNRFFRADMERRNIELY